MGFVTSIIDCFSKFAEFSGRASRSEFWWFMLFVALLTFGAEWLDDKFFPRRKNGPLEIATTLFVIVPSLAVSVRRLHDRNMRGWWIFLALTGVGGIVLIILYALKSNPHTNRFGNPPDLRYY